MIKSIAFLIVVFASQAFAGTAVAVFDDGKTDYQTFLLSNPKAKIISVTRLKSSQGDVVQDEDGEAIVIRRVVKSGLMVTYED